MFPGPGFAAASSLAMLLTVVPTAASAQTPSQSAGSAKAQAPEPLYRSAFEGYRGHADEPKLAPWREANDVVGRIGGWRAYAQEAQEAQKPAAAPDVRAPAVSLTTPAAAPAASPHMSHRVSPGHQGEKR